VFPVAASAKSTPARPLADFAAKQFYFFTRNPCSFEPQDKLAPSTDIFSAFSPHCPSVLMQVLYSRCLGLELLVPALSPLILIDLFAGG
jgi:hypothetical protein